MDVMSDGEEEEEEGEKEEEEGEKEQEEEEEETQFHVDMDYETPTPNRNASDSLRDDDVVAPVTKPTLNGKTSDSAYNDGVVSMVTTSLPRQLGPSLYLRRVMKDDMAEALDVLMKTMQEYVLGRCFQEGKLVTEEAVSVLQSLLKIFSDIILPTHAISHVQFLLFHVTSLHKEFPGLFLDFLWRKFEDISTAVVHRQTAAAYIASYVARAKFVTLDTVKLCLGHMMQWLHQYLGTCSPSSLGPYIAQHGPFFSLCQTVFYIFIFWHKSLISMEKGLSFLRNLNFERIVSSKLNPLKVCLPSVVEVFTRIASRHEVVFCYTILEENKRLLLTLQTTIGGQTNSPTQNYLDCFFPFDPYWLKRSSQCIKPIYQEWQEEVEETDKEADKLSDIEEYSTLSSLESTGLELSYSSPCVDTLSPTS